MAALSSGYLLHVAEKKGSFRHDSEKLFAEVFKGVHSDFVAEIFDDIYDAYGIKDAAAKMKKYLPAGKIMSKAVQASASKWVDTGKDFTKSMAQEVMDAMPAEAEADAEAGQMRDAGGEDPEDMARVMMAILKKSLTDPDSVLEDVQRIIGLSGDEETLTTFMDDFQPLIRVGLQVKNIERCKRIGLDSRFARNRLT